MTRRAWLRQEFLLNCRYAIAGLVNTAVGLLAIWGLMAIGVGPFLANVLGYGCGLMTAFVGSRLFVFASRAPIGRQGGRFIVAFVASYGLNLLVLYGGLQWELDAYATQILAMAAYVICMYGLQRLWVFGRSG